MKKWAILFIGAALTGQEVLLVFFMGKDSIVLVLSLLPLILGAIALFFLFRLPTSKNSEIKALPSTTEPLPSSQEIITEVEPSFGSNETIPAWKEEIDIYEKSLPALFKSIVNYLNTTTEPMSESLVVIKTSMNNFITQVQMNDKEIVNANTLNVMTGNVDRLQVNINQVAQKSIDAFNVFGKEVQSLKDVLESISRLTGDISEIAERVHVLSINASIESARAGINGRGFKVIANEIQKLAHETQSFLKDIKITEDSSKNIFSFLDHELENNKTQLIDIVQREKETFGTLTGTITRHYGQFKDLYSGILQFIKEMEGNMNALFPLSMLHAIIIQEVENLDLVTKDFLQLLKNEAQNHSASVMVFKPVTSIERLRKRLTTSRELDALDSAIENLGLGKTVNLKRSTNDFELF